MFLLLPVFTLTACRSARKFTLQLREAHTINTLPSGSGMAIEGDTVFIVGDDATVLYKVSTGGRVITKHILPGVDSSVFREPKSNKHDLEAAALADWNGARYLLAFGSGSSSPIRDSLLLYSFDQKEASRFYSLAPLYRHLRGKGAARWNVEGAAIAGSELILLDRANNGLYRMSVAETLNFVTARSSTPPAFTRDSIPLPSVRNYPARLSGAALLDENRLLFCASVEATTDWVKDGEVLGSFVGIWNLRSKKLEALCRVEDSAHKSTAVKLESVELLEQKGKDITIIAIADNDDGSTGWMRMVLKGR